ncbi:MAG: hypothetical protein WAO35_22235 [Terriglobia bacterium]
MANILESMARIVLRSRRLMAVSILFLLAGVVILSTATREPCLQASSAPWHLWKAGHMTESEGQETCKLRVTAEAQTPQTTSTNSLITLPLIYFSREETIPPVNSIVARIRHFRSPPTLG